MALPLLAAALIVRDEAARLPGCLAALAALGPLVDSVVVHDTGSADDSREIARAAGATVVEGSWQADFALARNVALAATSARWVLMVDADERVVADPDALRALLESTDADGVALSLTNVTSDGHDLYTAPLVRILRPDVARFDGRLHERPVRRAGPAPLRLVEAPRDVVSLRHLGYADAAEVQRKAVRNLELADAQVAAAETDADAVRALYHRGRTLLTAGRADAALADLERLRATGAAPVERIWGLDVLAQLYLAVGRLGDADAVVAELRALGAEPGYCGWLQARSLLARERWAEALELLRPVDRLVDTVGRELDVSPVVEAQMIAAGRIGAVDEAAASCIRLMAGLGRAEGLGPLLLTLWGNRPAEWLVELLRGADGGHRDAVAAELRRCDAPGPAVAAALVAG
jgi:tetratricopeptide (TPR) repeat protein